MCQLSILFHKDIDQEFSLVDLKPQFKISRENQPLHFMNKTLV